MALDERMILQKAFGEYNANLMQKRIYSAFIGNDIRDHYGDTFLGFADGKGNRGEMSAGDQFATCSFALKDGHLPCPPQKKGGVDFEGGTPEIQWSFFKGAGNGLWQVSQADKVCVRIKCNTRYLGLHSPEWQIV